MDKTGLDTSWQTLNCLKSMQVSRKNFKSHCLGGHRRGDVFPRHQLAGQAGRRRRNIISASRASEVGGATEYPARPDSVRSRTLCAPCCAMPKKPGSSSIDPGGRVADFRVKVAGTSAAAQAVCCPLCEPSALEPPLDRRRCGARSDRMVGRSNARVWPGRTEQSSSHAKQGTFPGGHSREHDYDRGTDDKRDGVCSRAHCGHVL
jgi:hypothetical protein